MSRSNPESNSPVYVVTGGSRGIGAAVTRRLARGRGTVVVAYRSDAGAAESLAREITTAKVVPVQCDVRNETEIDRLFDVVDEHGPLVGLVNSAGILREQAALVSITADRWHEVLSVNVIGTALCCRAAITRMRSHRIGPRAIVNLSSRAALLGSPNEYVDYAASKAAVDALTVAGEHIRVNAVRPGIIRTQMHASGGEPERAERLGPGQPMGRAGDPAEVAAAIVWLLSDEASFVTGAHLDVSGGR